MKKEILIVGCGFAGSVLARRLAQEKDCKVTILEKRGHIAGNMYDCYDRHGVLVHRYGPHILVLNQRESFEFLSHFTQWTYYEHRVLADIDGVQVPLPINFTSIGQLFSPHRAQQLQQLLLEQYGAGAQIPILDLLCSSDPSIRDFAEFIYRKVFLDYTTKMWDLTPTQVDPSVTARIPVRLSYDSRHFQHRYQYMPREGYTQMFRRMLDHPNIQVHLHINGVDHLQLKEGTVYLDGTPFAGQVIYTGAVDELLGYRYGVLPYRSLQFQWETWNRDFIQASPVLNWPDKRPATRRTEMKRLTQQEIAGVTTTLTEIPGAYHREDPVFSEPYYPIVNDACREQYQKYVWDLQTYPQLTLVGRLAQYRYFNMEAALLQAFSVFDQLCQQRDSRN